MEVDVDGSAELDETVTTHTGSSRELVEGTRKAKKHHVANLKSLLKTKGVDMDRAAVAKADKRKD